MTLFSTVLAWCKEGHFHDGPYVGPKHPCPESGAIGGRVHFMRPRRGWLCAKCNFFYAQLKLPTNHVCED